jgi:hypothetical protein
MFMMIRYLLAPSVSEKVNMTWAGQVRIMRFFAQIERFLKLTTTDD